MIFQIIAWRINALIVATAPADLDGTLYLVNTSGAIQKASASTKSSSRPELGNGFKDFKDSNDKIWVVDRNGIIQQ